MVAWWRPADLDDEEGAAMALPARGGSGMDGNSRPHGIYPLPFNFISLCQGTIYPMKGK